MTDDAAKPKGASTIIPASVPTVTTPPNAPDTAQKAAAETARKPGLADGTQTNTPAAEPLGRAAPARSESPSRPVAASNPAVQEPSRASSVVLPVVALLVLAGAGYLFWASHNAAAGLAQQLDGLQQNLASLDQRLAAVEKRPVPAPVNLGPIDQRLTALDQRLTAEENKPPAQAQIDAAGHAEIAGLAGRIDQILARQDQLGQREQADIGKLGDQMAAQDTRIAAQDARIASASQAGSTAGGQVSALVAREAQLASLQAASGALAAGRPLGPMPGAPPALAQFAEKPPPTEASLRLSFADAARSAHEAGMPAQGDTPFMQRMWNRMQSSVTVRQGDHVVVGDAVSGILAQAQSQLDAGDLAGTVATLGQLSGPAASAMTPWRQRAQALLDARSALLSLARG